MTDFIKSLLQSNPARFVNYSVVAAIWLAVKGSELLGVPLAPDSDAALWVGSIAATITTEVIRKLVYSPKTVSEIVAQTPPGAAPAVAEKVLEGSPPAVQPQDLPGGGAA